MAWLPQLFSRRRRYEELSESIREHLEEKIADLMDGGKTREQAEQTARREFGNVTRIEERSREAWQWPTVESIWADVKFALRQLRKSPGFTATAVLTLALGIGGLTTVFSVVYAVLLRPLPYTQAGRLVILHQTMKHTTGEGNLAPPEYAIFLRENRAFSGVGGFISSGYEVSGAGAPFLADAERVTSSLFPTLGVPPLLGRTFTEKEDADSAPATVISYALWKDRFGGNADALGKTIDLDLRPYTIIGVMPRGFETPTGLGEIQTHDLWVPMSLTPVEKNEMDNDDFGAVARLKPGVSMDQARQDVERVEKTALVTLMGDAHLSMNLRNLKDQTVNDARSPLRILLGAVVLILLIACANLANLLLVRAAGRQHECGIRMALGAPRKKMLRQSLIESLLLSALSGGLGLFLAVLLVKQAPKLLPDSLPRMSELTFHWPVALLAIAMAGATGLLCGLVPALASTNVNVLSSLREGGQMTGQGRSQHRLRSTLVVAEMALAMLLLVSAGLLLRSFARMLETDPGFQPDHTITASLALPRQSYPTQEAVDEFFSSLARRVQAIPGVEEVGFGSSIPVTGRQSHWLFSAQGYVPKSNDGYSIAANYLTAGKYFAALRIPLIKGRYLDAADNDPGAPPVIAISQSLARRYFAGRNPIGMHIKVGPNYQYPMPAMRVVGVVGDVSDNPVDQKQNLEIYAPLSQAAADFGPMAATMGVIGSMHVVMRVAGDPQALEGEFQRAARQANPLLAVTNLETMNEVVSSTEAPRRFNTSVLTVFAGIALALALLGIYGVLAYTVSERAREIAIRMALGATRGDVVRRTLGYGTLLSAVGVTAGFAASAGLTRYLASQLYEVKPLDGPTLVAAAAALLACAALAGWLPARRAASIDPMRALRSE